MNKKQKKKWFWRSSDMHPDVRRGYNIITIASLVLVLAFIFGSLIVGLIGFILLLFSLKPLKKAANVEDNDANEKASKLKRSIYTVLILVFVVAPLIIVSGILFEKFYEPSLPPSEREINIELDSPEKKPEKKTELILPERR